MTLVVTGGGEEFVRLVKLGLNQKLGVDKKMVSRYLEENTYPKLIQKALNELYK